MNPMGYWTKERCFKAALKYNTRKEFRMKEGGAYNSAHLNGWLQDACRHMARLVKPQGYWSKEECRLEARKYLYKKDFEKKSRSAYHASYINGWLNDICSHMLDGRVYWTKEKCKQHALKYNSYSDFRENEPVAYAKSLKNNWLKYVCAHIDYEKSQRGYWTKEKCLNEAKKYTYIKDFAQKCPQAYRKSVKMGWKKDVYGHLKNTEKNKVKWTKEACEIEAKKYKSRTAFAKCNPGAYDRAVKKKWIDGICEHMDFIQKGLWGKKKIYRLVWIKDKKIYIGITNNPKRRMHEHLKCSSNSSVKQLLLENKTPEIVVNNIWHHSSYCAKKEKEIIKKYKNAEWDVINKSSGGELGCSASKWNYDTLWQESLKYTSVKEFYTKSSAAYTRARDLGYLHLICKHMEYGKKPNGYWTKEQCKLAASRYKNRSEFAKYSRSAYNKSSNNKWLDEFFPKK